MLVETMSGHAGTGTMFAAFLAVPWSMLVAGFAPPLPHDWPMAAGLAVRMIPLALFMLLNAAIIGGIAARSERDLGRTAPRVGGLLCLCALLGYGCKLTTRQEVFVAAPKQTFLLFNGGKEEVYCDFDLSTSAQWLDQRGDITRVNDLAITGDFQNHTGGFGGLPVPLDVKIAASPDPFPPSDPGRVTWGPIRIDTTSTRRVEWEEGTRLMLADHSALEHEIRGDGKFTLRTISTPQITLNGTVGVENLRLVM